MNWKKKLSSRKLWAAVIGVGGVELLIGGIIKIAQARDERKNRKDDERDAGKYLEC